MPKILKWIPALSIMGVIFYFSSRPSTDLPNFGWADFFLKKGGHFTEYALLVLSFWYALDWKPDIRWLAWLLTFLFAVTDEFHQSFVAGRHPSVWDVVIFDNLGALVSLWVTGWWKRHERNL